MGRAGVCFGVPMTKLKRNSRIVALDDGFANVKKRKTPPYPFVLEALDGLSPETKPMFGCLAVYVGDKIVVILREKVDESEDNGVWLATTKEHHESLRLDFPSMRSIRGRGKKLTGWQVLPADAGGFEEAAMRACELVIGGDPRIGKVPESRRMKTGTKKKSGRTEKKGKFKKRSGRSGKRS